MRLVRNLLVAKEFGFPVKPLMDNASIEELKRLLLILMALKQVGLDSPLFGFLEDKGK